MPNDLNSERHNYKAEDVYWWITKDVLKEGKKGTYVCLNRWAWRKKKFTKETAPKIMIGGWEFCENNGKYYMFDLTFKKGVSITLKI